MKNSLKNLSPLQVNRLLEIYARTNIYSINDLRHKLDASGSRFLKPETMKTWGSRLSSAIYPLHGAYAYLFITSEKLIGDMRTYHIRYVQLSDDGKTASVIRLDAEEFTTHYSTLNAAKSQATRIYKKDLKEFLALPA